MIMDTDFPSQVQGDLDSALTPRVTRLLETAEANGWEPSHNSFVVRLAKPGDELAKPFFIRWDLFRNAETGKRSWRFAGARAQNGQPLNYRDALVYLGDPSVIYPEPPEGNNG